LAHISPTDPVAIIMMTKHPPPPNPLGFFFFFFQIEGGEACKKWIEAGKGLFAELVFWLKPAE